MINLKSKCIHNIAMEIARPRVASTDGWQAWPRETDKAVPESIEAINIMTNIELLDVITRVFDMEDNS